TLMRIIAGLDTPDEGKVWVHKDVKTVMLQQSHHFDASKTIRENIFRLDHPAVETVRDYEDYLESGSQNEALLTDLVTRMDEGNAWTLESDLKQILGKLNIHHLNEP